MHWLALAAVAYLIYAGLAWAMQDRIVFPRHFIGPAPEGPPRAGVERWLLETDGGPVEAWFVLGAGRSAESPGPAVVFFHGNAELIDHCLLIADYYRSLGISALLAEYRGYGRSAGDPSQRAIVTDMTAWVDRLAARPEVDGARIVYHGRSLGGGVAAALSEVRAPAAVVVESTFTSAAAMAQARGLPGFLARHPFRSDEALKKLGRPVLIMHGTQDEIIPVGHGRRLHARVPGSVYREMEGGHLDFPRDWAAYSAAIGGFLRVSGILGSEGEETK